MNEKLCQNLGHDFGQPELLARALTHRSAGRRNNERLEFLGDGLLNFVIGAEVFRLQPRVAEGDLSRLRASLVRGDTLAEIAGELELGEYIKLGQGELKSGGFRRHSILADTMEAVLGAVYLDAGFDAGQKVILGLYKDRLRKLPDSQSLKDPKTRLQEYLQKHHYGLPQYEVLSITGEQHRQMFRVRGRIADLDLSLEGSGRSRRRAEQDAATQLLEAVDEC